MSYNGSGTFLINTAGQPVVSGTVISSTAFNALTADLATGLSTAITKDGQTTVTANIPMSTYKFTGLGAGSAATDSANLSQVQSTVSKLLNTITGTNTITATASPTLSAYAAGQMFYFVAAGDNTTAVTLNIDGLGAKAVTRDGSTALISGDIKSGEVVVVVYDGTRFQVVSQVNSAGDATFANVSITSALNVGGVSTFTGLITANGGVSGALNGTVGATTPNTGSFTTLTTSSTFTLNGGTANGVAYLNGSKVLTSGSALTFDGTNLGLGAASRPSRLTLEGTNGAVGSQIQLVGTGVLSGYIGPSADGLNFGTDSGGLIFRTGVTGNGSVTTGSEGMRLTSTGLGIGTSSPAYKLDVNGAANFADNTIHRCGGQPMFARGGASLSYLYAGTSAMVWRNNADSADLMRLDSSGNLGIGVTPTNNTLGKTLQVGQAGAWVAESGSNRWWLASNWYYNSGDKYINNGHATLYSQQSGQHQWLTAASGTAGNAITFTQAMTLDASGNLGIGTTSPNLYAGYTTLAVNNATNGGLIDILVNGTRHLTIYGGSSTSVLGTASNTNLSFITNNTERARITSGGDFLVAKTTNADTTVGFTIFGGAGGQQGAITSTLAGSTSANTTLQVYSTGATAYRFYVGMQGTVYATNTTITAISDARLKENIRDLDAGLDAIMALKPRKFDWKEGKGKGIKNDRGFVAQEFEQVFPDLIDTWKDPAPEGEEPYKAVRADLIPVLVKAIQELKAELDALKGAK